MKEAQKNGLRLFAIGDLNNDKQNDIVTVNQDQNGFSAQYFRQTEYKFKSGLNNESAPVTYVESGYKIT